MTKCWIPPLFAILVSVCGAAQDLAIQQATVHVTDDGATATSDYRFQPGDTAYFSFVIAGFQKSEENQIKLAYTIEAHDPAGVLISPQAIGHIAVGISQEDKHWQPKVRENLVVPSLAGSGRYEIAVKLRDELAEKDIDTRVVFQVEGRDVQPSDTLILRNFRFVRGENDEKALDVAAYRAGDTVWARFDMTGYKFGEGNRFEVAYGLTVLRPDGTVTYSQPEAATAAGESFYPQRYAPGELSLNCPKDLPRGEYTLVVQVHDKAGGQTYEMRQKFSIE